MANSQATPVSYAPCLGEQSVLIFRLLALDMLVVLRGRRLRHIDRIGAREGFLKPFLQRAVSRLVLRPGLAGIGGIGMFVDGRRIEAWHRNLHESSGPQRLAVPRGSRLRRGTGLRSTNWAGGTGVLENEEKNWEGWETRREGHHLHRGLARTASAEDAEGVLRLCRPRLLLGTDTARQCRGPAEAEIPAAHPGRYFRARSEDDDSR